MKLAHLGEIVHFKSHRSLVSRSSVHIVAHEKNKFKELAKFGASFYFSACGSCIYNILRKETTRVEIVQNGIYRLL